MDFGCTASSFHRRTEKHIAADALRRWLSLDWTTAMAKPRGTDGSLLLSLPWTLAALAVSLAPHVQFLPFWITGAFFICAAWRYIIEKRRRPLPSTWFRAALALVCFLGVLATYSSVSGSGRVLLCSQ